MHPFNRPSKRLRNTKFLLVHPLVQNHPMVIFCCEGYTRMLFIRTFPNLLVQRLLLVPRNLHLLPPPSHPLKLRFLSEERNRFHHLVLWMILTLNLITLILKPLTLIFCLSFVSKMSPYPRSCNYSFGGLEMEILLTKLEVQGWSQLLQGDIQHKFAKPEMYKFCGRKMAQDFVFTTTVRG